MKARRLGLSERNRPSSAAARARMPASVRRVKTQTPDHSRTDDRNADYRTVVPSARRNALNSDGYAESNRRRNCRGKWIAMSEQEAFGPRLRRERERRGISLDHIALLTNVTVDLWMGLERNDFSLWPGGLFARAFIRDYANAIGLDADEVVDDFCRLFPLGDRRANSLIRAQSEVIGHETTYADDRALIPGGVDRRTGEPSIEPAKVPARRWFGARLFDAVRQRG
jgi:transcriptional regulator with XRE-family HTH domain